MVTEPDMDIWFSSSRHLRTSTRTGSHELTSEMTSCQQTWRSHLGWEAWSPVRNGESCGRNYELPWRRSYNQAKYIPVYADLTTSPREFEKRVNKQDCRCRSRSRYRSRRLLLQDRTRLVLLMVQVVQHCLRMKSAGRLYNTACG